MGPIHLPRQDVSDIARGNALGPGTAIDHACALPIAPARVNASANGSVDLDLQHLFNQFPSEDTLTTIVDPSDPLVEGSPVVLIDIDPTLAREAFPSESMLLVIPAGPVVVYPSAVERSSRDTAARWHDAVRRRSTVIVLGTIAFGQMLGWTAWLTIRVARGLWSSAWQGVVALRSVIGELVIRIAGLIQSRGRLAIHWRRRLGSPATALISHFGRTLRWGARLLIQSARAASLAIRRRAHDLQPGRFLSRQLRSTQQWIAIQINRTLRLAGQRLNAISRPVRSMRRTPVTRITRVLNATWQRYRWTHASRAACHRSLSGLRQALVSTAPRFGVLTVIITSVIATGIFAWTQWRAPLGAAPLAVASLGIVPLAVAPIESRSIAFENPPRRAAVTTPQIDSPAVPVVALTPSQSGRSSVC